MPTLDERVEVERIRMRSNEDRDRERKEKLRELTDRNEVAEGSFTRLTKEDAKEYYEYARKEIEREDALINQRMTATLALQGFLITSVAILLGSNPLKMIDIPLWRVILVEAVCLCGFLVTLSSVFGILAARHSLLDAKKEWILFNRVNQVYPRLRPQLTRRSNELHSEAKLRAELQRPDKLPIVGWINERAAGDFGGLFPLSIPIVMSVFWVVLWIWLGAHLLMRLTIADNHGVVQVQSFDSERLRGHDVPLSFGRLCPDAKHAC